MSQHSNGPRWPEAVRSARISLGASVIRFAKIARVARQTATQWERNGTYPRAPAFARILLELRAHERHQEFDQLLGAAARAREARP